MLLELKLIFEKQQEMCQNKEIAKPFCRIYRNVLVCLGNMISESRHD
jgi:hypothetical protein